MHLSSGKSNVIIILMNPSDGAYGNRNYLDLVDPNVILKYCFQLMMSADSSPKRLVEETVS